MKVYLASAYSRQSEMRDIAAQLVAAGHKITARWIDGRHETPPEGLAVDSREHLAWAATEDIDDIAAADCVVSVTGGGNRGGRHVEFGIALALTRWLVILGERENVFHSMEYVDQVTTVDELIALLAE